MRRRNARDRILKVEKQTNASKIATVVLEVLQMLDEQQASG